MRRLLAAGGLAVAACTCWLLFSGAASARRATISDHSRASSGSYPLRGIVALGHSTLTGENSNPQRPGAPAFQNSVGQATKALGVDPNPRLVIVEIIGTDIRCHGSNSKHYPVFGRQVKAALDLIVRKAPHTTILLLSQVGTPLQIAKAIVGTPGVQAWSGSDTCSAFNPDRTVDMKHIKALTGIIEGYESELTKVCATVPACHTDRGRAAHLRVRASYYNYSNFDWHHFNVTGLAALARFMWPTIADLLNLH